MKIDLIAGARPNFIKISSIVNEINNFRHKGYDIIYRLIHTGQHYDKNMSQSFFEQLDIPEPHFNLECGGGTQAELTAKIMVAYEKLLLEESTDLCLVVGDVTSTLACSITAKKLNIKVAHVEAGIRSYDLTMPEEINRMVTDSITDYFFTTTQVAGENLKKSGIRKENIFFVGNTMIDTLIKHQSRFFAPSIWDELKLKNHNYLILTLHRPANVDEEKNLKVMINEIVKYARNLPIIFPIHPRTKKIFDKLNIRYDTLYTTDPLSYLEFNYLVKNAKAVITDSGGITEETTVLGIPCITLRNNTERPETITEGTNELIGTDPKAIKPVLDKLFEDNWKKGAIPELWDGNSGERIIRSLLNIFN